MGSGPAKGASRNDVFNSFTRSFAGVTTKELWFPIERRFRRGSTLGPVGIAIDADDYRNKPPFVRRAGGAAAALKMPR